MTNERTRDALNFTGNWYLDLGILGFLRIMEEFWRLSLDDLRDIVNKDTDRTIFGFFPIAYFHHLLSRKIDDKFEEAHREGDKLEKELKKLSLELEDITEQLKSRRSKKLLAKKEKLEEKRKFLEKELNEFRKKLKELEDKYRDLISMKNKNNLKESIEKLHSKEGIFNVAWEYIRNLAIILQRISNTINELKKRKKKSKKQTRPSKDSSSSVEGTLKIPVSSLFLHNFMMFNPSLSEEDAFKACLWMILSIDLSNPKTIEMSQRFIESQTSKSKGWFMKQLETLQKLDKTISKFLASESKLTNVYYAPTNSRTLYKLIRIPPLVFLMCFELAFERFGDLGNYAFYSPDLEFAYTVNKKMRIKKEYVKGKGILRFTWDAIIDSLHERYATWVLEDMYIIKYDWQRDPRTGKPRPVLIKVEYIGIDKLRASLIIDDKIRRSLNLRLVIRKDKEVLMNVWLIERFLQGDSLYPLILTYFRHIVSEHRLEYPKQKLKRVLATEIALLKAKRTKKLFGLEFFEGEWIVKNNIREFLANLRMVSKIVNIISTPERDKLASFILKLLSALERRNRNIFMNILLTELNKYRIEIPDNVLKALFSNTFMKEHWEYFALGLLISLWG